jgi:Uma2 family endonuclease
MMAAAHLEASLMAGAVRQHAPILSVASFRAWLASRPDEEHWELIEGVPMMMTPPNRRHQRITSNLESLLNAALKRHDPSFAAYHDIGVNIVSTVPYDPEPDVAVIREDENPDPRYAERFYLVAEVLSESDKDVIEGKRDIYRSHASCTCILLVRQDRPEVIVDRRTPDGWRSQVLHGADELALPEFGLACRVKDIYRDTPLG